MKKNKKNQGFTLIEILITLAITAIVGIGLATFLTPQLNVYQALNRSSDAKSTCNTVFNLVQSRIRGGKDFVSSGDTLTFTPVTAAGTSETSVTISSSTFDGEVAAEYRGHIRLQFDLADLSSGNIAVTVTVMNDEDAAAVYSTTQTVKCRNAALPADPTEE